MGADDVEVTRQFNEAIRARYARTQFNVEADGAHGAPVDGHRPRSGTTASESDFGSGVRRAVVVADGMNTLLRRAARGGWA